MTSREETWRRFVAAYPLEVPQEAIDNERAYIELELRHRMQYDRLSGGGAHLFPQRELAEQEEEIEAAAEFEAKAPRVVKALIADLGLVVTPEELEVEAEAIAERQGASMELVKRFFGDDLSLLARDVLERKAIDWTCEQSG